MELSVTRFGRITLSDLLKSKKSDNVIRLLARCHEIKLEGIIWNFELGRRDLTYERDESVSFLRQPQLPVCPTQLDDTALTLCIF
jgi:hypothetical protein